MTLDKDDAWTLVFGKLVEVLFVVKDDGWQVGGEVVLSSHVE